MSCLDTHGPPHHPAPSELGASAAAVHRAASNVGVFAVPKKRALVRDVFLSLDVKKHP
ncbi:MAG: hypothetical protein KIT84_13460 [Labilithrix sp.]|nr:hypothetical protein [Labilithrix sp.]